MKKSRETALGHEDFRHLLLEKRAEVSSALAVKFDTQARMGRVAEEDQAPISHDEFVSFRLNGLDYAQLRLIEEAMDRLNSGDFGICFSCDEPIPPKRLRAIPWARYCLLCQDAAVRERNPYQDDETVPGRFPAGVK